MDKRVLALVSLSIFILTLPVTFATTYSLTATPGVFSEPDFTNLVSVYDNTTLGISYGSMLDMYNLYVIYGNTVECNYELSVFQDTDISTDIHACSDSLDDYKIVVECINAPGEEMPPDSCNSGNDGLIVTLTPIESLDSDSDGVPDSQDLCPNTPFGAVVDANGCAASPYDVDVSISATSASLGGISTVTVTITNIGSETLGFPAVFLFFPGLEETRDYSVQELNAISPGETKTVYFTINVKNSVSIGEHSIKVRVEQCEEPGICGPGTWSKDFYDTLTVITPPDSDSDGVPDSQDICSNTPFGAAVDANGCAPSQKDSDGDGITDDIDQCPTQPETFNSYQDTDGCPDVVPTTPPTTTTPPHDVATSVMSSKVSAEIAQMGVIEDQPTTPPPTTSPPTTVPLTTSPPQKIETISSLTPTKSTIITPQNFQSKVKTTAQGTLMIDSSTSDVEEVSIEVKPSSTTVSPLEFLGTEVKISEYKDVDSSTWETGLSEDESLLGGFVKIDAPSLDFDWAVIKIKYTDEEMESKNLNEESLFLIYLDENPSSPTYNRWIKLKDGNPSWVHNVGVDKDENYVWANVSHFSVYGIGGAIKAAAPVAGAEAPATGVEVPAGESKGFLDNYLILILLGVVVVSGLGGAYLYLKRPVKKPRATDPMATVESTAEAPGYKDAISVSGFSKKYKNSVILKDVSFTIPRATLSSLVGLSGGGKSTIIEAIAGRVPPDSGKVLIAGIDADKNRKELNKLVGFVPQHPELNMNQTVWENMLNSSVKWEVKEAGLKSTKLLKQLGILDRKDVVAKNLSGGQLKRLSLAMELIREPEILVLDEPTTGLDPTSRDQILTALTKIVTTSKQTVLFTTHFMDEAEHCDEVIVIGDAKVLAKGSPSQLARKLPGMGKIVSITLEEVSETLVKELEKLPSVKKVIREGRVLKIICDKPDPVELSQKVKELGGTVEGSKVKKAGMKEVFVYFTGKMPEE